MKLNLQVQELWWAFPFIPVPLSPIPLIKLLEIAGDFHNSLLQLVIG